MKKTSRRTRKHPKQALDLGAGLESLKARALIRAHAAAGRTPAESAKILRRHGFQTTARGVGFLREWEYQNQIRIAIYASAFNSPADMIRHVPVFREAASLALQHLEGKRIFALKTDSISDLKYIGEAAFSALKRVAVGKADLDATRRIADDLNHLTGYFRSVGMLPSDIEC